MTPWTKTWATRLFVAAIAIAPPATGDAEIPSGSLFRTADNCMACHNGLTTPAGEEVSIGSSWRASMMANAARDPYWQAAVRREVMDHPESQAAIEGECSRCHMPMATVEVEAAGGQGEVFRHLPIGGTDDPADLLAADGVSCTVCHQIQDDNLGSEESFTGHFVVDTKPDRDVREIFGPNGVDDGRATIMQSASTFRPTEASHIKESELCASCHTLFTHALDPEGQVIGRLPEQTPYLEWLASDFRETTYCQDCHMPVAEDDTPIASVWGQPRDEMSRHEFRGGNFFMMRMLNRYRAELGVQALPQELELAALRTVEHLQSAAATVTIEGVEVAGGRLQADVVVKNLAGHKLPTAYPSRRAWLHVTVRNGKGQTIFESGAFRPDGSIEDNDNDTDPSQYEPHHTEIENPNDVQIYESILADQAGHVTTGLLSGLRYAKDNRILPKGFDKAAASEDIAVRGGAATDDDFRGGQDRTRYVVNVSEAEGPFTLEAALWYQPIGYRWAENLREYDSFETNRFTAYYESMAAGSAVVLARAAATTR
jgi:hypothetical protein